jgi:hypothetical protein
LHLRILKPRYGLFTEALEDAVRQVLAGGHEETVVSITAAMDAYHAEVVITSSAGGRVAYFASLCLSADEHARKLRPLLAAERRIPSRRIG